MIRAVFFDAGNTLIYPYPSIGAIYSAIAQKHGMSFDKDEAHKSFKQAFLRHSAEPLDNQSRERAWWRCIVREAIGNLCRERNFEAYFDELFDFFTKAEAWRLYPDVMPTLDMLRSRGTPLGVISNWDSRLLPLFDNLELTHYFSVIAVSALIGCAKPEPGIFKYALGKLDVSPEEAIHIGDSVELDVRGASSCGLQSLLIDRDNRMTPNTGISTIRSLDEISQYIRSQDNRGH